MENRVWGDFLDRAFCKGGFLVLPLLLLLLLLFLLLLLLLLLLLPPWTSTKVHQFTTPPTTNTLDR